MGLHFDAQDSRRSCRGAKEATPTKKHQGECHHAGSFRGVASKVVSVRAVLIARPNMPGVCPCSSRAILACRRKTSGRPSGSQVFRLPHLVSSRPGPGSVPAAFTASRSSHVAHGGQACPAPSSLHDAATLVAASGSSPAPATYAHRTHRAGFVSRCSIASGVSATGRRLYVSRPCC